MCGFVFYKEKDFPARKVNTEYNYLITNLACGQEYVYIYAYEGNMTILFRYYKIRTVKWCDNIYYISIYISRIYDVMIEI
jgi:hypothetical protein